MGDYFIADLHLGPQRPQITEICLHFLNNEAQKAERLFILGDLFEYWLGDDAIHPHYQPIIDSLKNLSSQGVAIFFMPGNRDFLVGAHFYALTGITALNDPTVIQVSGTATLLSHGDIFCSDDSKYQQFRAEVRSSQWQTEFLAKSVEERIEYAEKMRNASRSAKKEKSEQIMDVNKQTVINSMQEHGVSRLIHGHTHRPAQHEFEVEGGVFQRVVLASWESSGHALICDKHRCSPKTFS